MPRLDEIAAALGRFRPALVERDDVRRAAVAMVLRDGRDGAPEVLFIERARSEGDPWSGHMAFPGGRMDAADPSVRHAAERETLEEVGLELAGARALGRLDDLEGRHAGRRTGLVVSGFVYHAPRPGPLAANEEVAETLWLPVSALLDPARHVRRPFPGAGAFSYPGIVVGDPERHVVWGLTYRFLEVFFGALDRRFPNHWGAELLAEGKA